MKKILLFATLIPFLFSCSVTESEEHKDSNAFYENVQKNIEGTWIGDDNPKKITFIGDKFKWVELDDVIWTGTWVVGRLHRNIQFKFDKSSGQTYTMLEGQITAFDKNKMKITCDDINFSSQTFKK